MLIPRRVPPSLLGPLTCKAHTLSHWVLSMQGISGSPAKGCQVASGGEHHGLLRLQKVAPRLRLSGLSAWRSGSVERDRERERESYAHTRTTVQQGGSQAGKHISTHLSTVTTITILIVVMPPCQCSKGFFPYMILLSPAQRHCEVGQSGSSLPQWLGLCPLELRDVSAMCRTRKAPSQRYQRCGGWNWPVFP